MLLDLQTFSSHLHPLLVHLPIGILLLAVLFELLSYSKKFQHLASSVSFIFLLGFIAAFVTSATGYLLSLTGEYDYQRLSNHQFGGIAVTVISGLLWGNDHWAIQEKIALEQKVICITCPRALGIDQLHGTSGWIAHPWEFLSFAWNSGASKIRKANECGGSADVWTSNTTHAREALLAIPSISETKINFES